MTDHAHWEKMKPRISVNGYRSWKLDRPARGSSGFEAQALYETENKVGKQGSFGRYFTASVL